MRRRDPVIGTWSSENAPGFPPPSQVFKYKRILRKSGKGHMMCMPRMVKKQGCYLWFHKDPFVALRTGMSVDFSSRLRQYDRDGGFSKRLGSDYLQKHRRPADDVYVGVWVYIGSRGFLWTVEAVIQARFQPIFNMTPPKINPGAYGWGLSLVPPESL